MPDKSETANHIVPEFLLAWDFAGAVLRGEVVHVVRYDGEAGTIEVEQTSTAVVEMPDILDREPDFNFMDFRDYCEMVAVRVGTVELEFLCWLYSEANGRR